MEIIYYIIKVELRRRGCAKWFHQIAEILLNFYIFKELKIMAYYQDSNSFLSLNKIRLIFFLFIRIYFLN